MFSRRLPPHADQNALTRAVTQLKQEGTPFIDLTESNPTAADLPYDHSLLAPLSDPAGLRYEPHPFGLASARSVIADHYRSSGLNVEAAQVVLTASTSEAYTWLFKLLCDPGDCVLVPRPSYPLFEHLTRLEAVRAEPYDLDNHGRWTMNVEALRSAPPDTRAVLVVSPNNPTGSYISTEECAALDRLCTERGWALVADEVFAEYPLDVFRPLVGVAARTEALTFSLGGLSKFAALPQVKLGWVVVGGRADQRAEALSALELIADSFLSVGTPIQLALPALLTASATVRTAIQQRTHRNLKALREVGSRFPACSVLRVEGGWSAVIRVPTTRTEEQLVLDLLQSERVLVHPGYFFDFPHESFLIVSLLRQEAVFTEAMTRVLRFASC